jgi:hypothetical protein
MEFPSPKRILAEACVFLAVLHGVIFLKEGQFIDTDTFAHLVRLQEMTSHGSVYASTVPRLNTPYGMDFHWTLPFDLFSLLFLAPFSLFSGWLKAIDNFAGWIGPATHFMAAGAALWAFKPLFQGWILRVLVFGVILGTLNIAYGSYGRVDHHIFMAAVWIMLLGYVIRFARHGTRLSTGIGAGIFAALCLWTSPEIYPGVIWAVGAMAAAWSLAPSQSGKAAWGFIASLFLSTAVILIVDHPRAGLGALDFGRYSWNNVVFSGLIAAAWILAHFTAARAEDPRRRFLILSFYFAAVAAIYLALFLGAAKSDSTLIATELLSHGVNEYHSPFHHQSLSDGWIIAGRTLLGLLAAVWIAWQDRRQKWNWAWACFLILIGGYSFLALRHVRFGVYTEILAPIPMAVLGWRWLQHLHQKHFRLDRYLHLLIFLLILTGPSVIGILTIPFEKEKHPLDQYQKQFSSDVTILQSLKNQLQGRVPDCDLQEILPRLNDPRFLDGPKRIGTEISYVPELLYRTPHHFIAGPYSFYDALRSAVDFLYLAPLSQSRKIAEERGIQYVLICPFDYGWYEAPHPDSLYVHAAKKIPVSWLEEVSWPEELETDFRLWRVVL